MDLNEAFRMIAAGPAGWKAHEHMAGSVFRGLLAQAAACSGLHTTHHYRHAPRPPPPGPAGAAAGNSPCLPPRPPLLWYLTGPS